MTWIYFLLFLSLVATPSVGISTSSPTTEFETESETMSALTSSSSTTTTATTVTPCRQDEIMCVSNRVCIARQFRCDGVPNCSDDSDEENCYGGCVAGNFTISNVPQRHYDRSIDLEFNCSFVNDSNRIVIRKSWTQNDFRVDKARTVDGKIILYFRYPFNSLAREFDMVVNNFNVSVAIEDNYFTMIGRVHITDINDPPIITEGSLALRLREGEQEIGWKYRLPITDPDSDLFIPEPPPPSALSEKPWGQFTVVGIDMPKEFEIYQPNATHTYLKLIGALDAEDSRWQRGPNNKLYSLERDSGELNYNDDEPSYDGNIIQAWTQFTLNVTDGGGLSTTANVTITIVDVNDNVPFCNNIGTVKASKTVKYAPSDHRILNISNVCHDKDVCSPPQCQLTARFLGKQECPWAFQVHSDYSRRTSIVAGPAFPPQVAKCTVSLVVMDNDYAIPLTFDVTFGECPADVDSLNVTWDKGWPGRKTYNGNYCPRGYSGTVYRYCDLNGVYHPPVYNCTKHELIDIEYLITRDVSKTDEALSRLVNATDSLYIGDIGSATNILGLITDAVSVKGGNVEADVNNYLDVADNLMAEKTKPLWESIINETGVGVDSIWSKMERFIENTATQNTSDTAAQDYAKTNFYLTVVGTNNCAKDISFPNRASGNVPTWAKDTADQIFLPCNEDTKGVSYSGCMYKDLRGQVPQRSVAKNDTDTTDILNSPVLALTLYHTRQTLSEPVALTFQLYESVIGFEPKCSYWNKTSKLWDTDGCRLESYNKEKGVVMCKCTHLTNFAILMSPLTIVPPEHADALNIISLVGCVTSMLFLVLTFVIYIYFWRYVAGERAVLLLTLCANLFLAYLVFLVGVDKVKNTGTCTFIAVFLHYIYLVVFFIMLTQGVILAKTVLRPFNKTPIGKWGLLASYGISAVIVGISMGASQMEGYGTSKFCWLSTSSGLIWAFIGPVVLIILVNAVFIVLILKQMFSTAAMQSKDAREKARTGLRSVGVLLPIMGVTWIFGVFSVNEDTMIFQYLFAIFNSIQGLLIFIFHCVMNKKVKTAIQKKMGRSPASYDTSTTNKKAAGTSQTSV